MTTRTTRARIVDRLAYESARQKVAVLGVVLVISVPAMLMVSKAAALGSLLTIVASLLLKPIRGGRAHVIARGAELEPKALASAGGDQ